MLNNEWKGHEIILITNTWKINSKNNKNMEILRAKKIDFYKNETQILKNKKKRTTSKTCVNSLINVYVRISF